MTSQSLLCSYTLTHWRGNNHGLNTPEPVAITTGLTVQLKDSYHAYP